MNNQYTMRQFCNFVIVLIVLATMGASASFAQVADTPIVIPAEVEVRGRGWDQIANLPEMLEFGFALVETTLFTAFLAFHPVTFGRRMASSTVDIRKGMFLFSFIGMLTGFLVLHHGYLIGFVIFGIGGLFRFRMETSSFAETGKLVIVSLIGLATGLDLPVMALIAAVAAWVIIWAFGQSEKLDLEVKFDEQSEPQVAMLHLKEHLEKRGYRVSRMSKAKFKPIAQYVLVSRKRNDQDGLVREMIEFKAEGDSGVVDWQLD
jgi:hypothetical protein